jgi:multidrug transporter EmrE-like cation transporter
LVCPGPGFSHRIRTKGRSFHGEESQSYAVWTSIGAAGTAIPGIVVLGDSAAPMRMLCIGLILTGVIGLKLVSGN